MHEWDDNALLREYVERDSEEAFAALVNRHVNQVYSAALRQTGNPSAAEEITQAVFVILARKSRRLGRRVILSGWLYQTARLTAVAFVRGEIRRARREQEARMQTESNDAESDPWSHIAPLLDAALAGLNEPDRHAVVLRFFDGKSLKEVGAALGANEDTARHRVNRAVEKLRRYFVKRGVLLPAAVLTAAISTHSVQAAPAGLAGAVTAVAFAKGAAAGGSTLTLIKGTLKIMAWTKIKTAVVVGAGVLLMAGTATVAVQKHLAARQYVVAREPWSDAGAATPKAALQSLAWALTHHKFDRAQELVQWDEKGAAGDDTRSMEHQMILMSVLAPHLGTIASFRVVSIVPTQQPDEVIVKFEKTFTNRSIMPFVMTAKLRRTGGQWRAVANVQYYESGSVSMLLPFTGSF
jgi:RNA polymerase sigma factor (sigma-70 family)